MQTTIIFVLMLVVTQARIIFQHDMQSTDVYQTWKDSSFFEDSNTSEDQRKFPKYQDSDILMTEQNQLKFQCHVSQEEALASAIPDNCGALMVDSKRSIEDEFHYFSFFTEELEEVLVTKDHEELVVQLVVQATHSSAVGRYQLKLLSDSVSQDSFHPKQRYPLSLDFRMEEGTSYVTLSLFDGEKRATVEHQSYLADLQNGGLIRLALNMNDYTYDLSFNKREITKGSIKDKLFFQQEDGTQSPISNVESLDIFDTSIQAIGVDGFMHGTGRVILAFMQMSTSIEEADDYDRYIVDTIKRRNEVLGNKPMTDDDYQRKAVSRLVIPPIFIWQAETF
jgi:hypothetical protein